jgi:hypothetical protein
MERVVIVWHNITTDYAGRHTAQMDGYQVGHPLVPVLRFLSPPSWDDSQTRRVLDWTYDQLNADFPTMDFSREYRACRNRSLSVGDVIQVAGQWHAVGRGFDFDQVEPPLYIVRSATTHGTTPLERDVRLSESPEVEAILLAQLRARNAQ